MLNRASGRTRPPRGGEQIMVDGGALRKSAGRGEKAVVVEVRVDDDVPTRRQDLADALGEGRPRGRFLSATSRRETGCGRSDDASTRTNSVVSWVAKCARLARLIVTARQATGSSPGGRVERRTAARTGQRDQPVHIGDRLGGNRQVGLVVQYHFRHLAWIALQQ